MAEADPVSGPGDAGERAAAASNLALRIVSAVVLAPLALLRGLSRRLAVRAVLGLSPRSRCLWEWMSAGRRGPRSGSSPAFGYAGIMLAGADAVARRCRRYGFLAMVLLFAVVWTTDILGYFAGRAFGGPKLLPAISPKKTWSGAIAGTLGAMIVAVLVAACFGSFNTDRDCDHRAAAVGGGAARRSVRILDQAPVRRQGCQPSHSRPWRRDGPARRFLGGGACRLRDRIAARRLRRRRARPAGMVSA